MHSCYTPQIGRKSIRVQGSVERKGAFILSINLPLSNSFIQNDSEALEIPLAWSSTYPQTFSGTDILLKAVTPTVLTVVVVTALSSEAYSQTCADNSALDEWLSFETRILRQGDILSVPKKSPRLVDTAMRYRLDMLEPTLQGYVESGTTKVIVVLSQTDSTIHDSFVDAESEQDAIEIDESFLGGSISNLSLDLQSPSIQNSPIGSYNNEAVERSYLGFSYKSLLSPLRFIEDHYTLFFRTSDLGKIGILNGDWVSAVIDW
jgi:peroxin-6